MKKTASVSPVDLEFVVGTLHLFRILKAHIEDTPGSPLSGGWKSSFRGFDGNNEGDLRAAANLVLDGREHFEESKACPRNSHMPMAATYQTMLTRWENMGRPTELTEEQAADICS